MIQIESVISLLFSAIALVLTFENRHIINNDNHHIQKVNILQRINTAKQSLFMQTENVKSIARRMLLETDKDNRDTIQKLLDVNDSCVAVIKNLDSFYSTVINASTNSKNKKMLQSVELKLLHAEGYIGTVKPLVDSILSETPDLSKQ